MPTVPLLENTQESCRVLLDSYLCLQKTLPDTLKFDLCPNQIAWERMPFLKNITGFLMAEIQKNMKNREGGNVKYLASKCMVKSHQTTWLTHNQISLCVYQFSVCILTNGCSDPFFVSGSKCFHQDSIFVKVEERDCPDFKSFGYLRLFIIFINYLLENGVGILAILPCPAKLRNFE
uniref:Thioredoxin-like 4ic n=1 Tax=Rhizophora mucronata TaxID=61149 RepID=A0A2P2KLL9_RHIMU